MTFQLRGPDGVRARIQELQARFNPGGDFEAAISGAASALGGLTGNISGDLQPMRPNTNGIRIVGGGNPARFNSMIKAAADDVGLNEDLFHALIESESSYNPFAQSDAGAMGLTQLMPQTAESLGVKNPFDPAENLRGGATYLANMIKRFGDKSLALAAYNAGPGAVIKHGGVPPYAQAYVDRVIAKFEARRKP